MITSIPANRSAARLCLIVASERVETNPAYAPASGLTHCNAFTSAVTVRMGAPIPLMLANQQHDWLDTQALLPAHTAWEKTDAHTAQAMADQGCLAVASWANPVPGGHGHIAILMPSLGEPGVWAAQAGAVNFTRELIQHGFGSGPLAPKPDFFVHP